MKQANAAGILQSGCCKSINWHIEMKIQSVCFALLFFNFISNLTTHSYASVLMWKSENSHLLHGIHLNKVTKHKWNHHSRIEVVWATLCSILNQQIVIIFHLSFLSLCSGRNAFIIFSCFRRSYRVLLCESMMHINVFTGTRKWTGCVRVCCLCVRFIRLVHVLHVVWRLCIQGVQFVWEAKCQICLSMYCKNIHAPDGLTRQVIFWCDGAVTWSHSISC